MKLVRAPLITVATVCYNAESIIANTIQSVRPQSWSEKSEPYR